MRPLARNVCNVYAVFRMREALGASGCFGMDAVCATREHAEELQAESMRGMLQFSMTTQLMRETGLSYPECLDQVILLLQHEDAKALGKRFPPGERCFVQALNLQGNVKKNQLPHLSSIHVAWLVNQNRVDIRLLGAFRQESVARRVLEEELTSEEWSPENEPDHFEVELFEQDLLVRGERG